MGLRYHACMHRIVLLLMIALLPLRLWAAEGMANTMALSALHVAAPSDSVASVDSVASLAASGAPWMFNIQVFTSLSPQPVESMTDDCPMMSNHQQSEPTGMASGLAANHCPACYMGAAVPLSIEIHTVSGSMRAAPPSSVAAFFQSAELRLARKPPIL